MHEFVLRCMADKKIHLHSAHRKQVTDQMARNADRIIVMTEKENLPGFIDLTKVEFWDVDDAKGQDYEFHCRVRDQIEQRVIKLVSGV